MIKKIIFLLSIAGIFYLQYSLYNWAYDSGYGDCKAEYLQEIFTLNQKNQEKEKLLNEKITNATIELTESRVKYENTINQLKSDYANELFKSEQRAEVYKRYSETDRAKQRDLAEYTAKLDRSLTEGRELVKQLTETIRTRDAQLRALGVYIQNGRSEKTN